MGTLVYLSLGSNLGDRIGYVQQAITLLTDHEHIQLLGHSSFYETEPLTEAPSTHSSDAQTPQDWYINVAVAIETELPPHELLSWCQRVEQLLGRQRDPNRPLGPRTMDVDILFYGEQIIDAPNLQIPHPRLHQRACVLVPFLEISPNWMHPKLKQTISELHQKLEAPEEVYLYGTRQLFSQLDE